LAGASQAVAFGVDADRGGEADVILPKQIVFDRNVRQIEFGSDFALRLAVDGSVWATGKNANKALGDPPPANSSAPTRIIGGIALIATRFSHTFLITTDGRLLAAGSNGNGELGIGTISHSEGFTRVRF
jgi:alpha-tubulin suppressor-like RCC1 family protein